MTIRVLHGDCREVLKTLPDSSVQCCVTSPPYYGLRDYGTATWEGGDAECDHIQQPYRAKTPKIAPHGGYIAQVEKGYRFVCGKCGATRVDAQIGLEQSPDAYIAELIAVFREVRRILRDDGCLWLNLGDSYAQSEIRHRNGQTSSTLRDGKLKADESWALGTAQIGRKNEHGLKPKDLIGIPWRVALALQADGWYLRSDVIWSKPKSMPESVTDRPTSAHEHVFLLTKSARYFFDADAVREGNSNSELSECAKDWRDRPTNGEWPSGTGGRMGSVQNGRNIRNVWTIATKPYRGAHFAVMPTELAETCIKAGTSQHGACANCGAPWIRVIERGKPDLEHQRICGGDADGEYHGTSTKDHTANGVQDASAVKARILAGMVEKTTAGWRALCKCGTASGIRPCVVLDPFGGAGTTGLVADRLGRSSILIDLNATYTETAIARMTDDCPMFVDVAPAAPEPHTPDMFAEAAE